MLTDYIYGKILFAVFIIICAVMDYRKHEVEFRVFKAMLAAELLAYIIMAIAGESINYASVISGALTGLGIYVMRLITRGGIGEGDAVFFTLTGLAIGGTANLIILLLSMMSCGALGVIINLNARRRVKTLPLLPVVCPYAILLLIV